MHTSKLKRLIKTLQSPDASKRRRAVEELAWGDERAIYYLIMALRDQNFGVQDAAMRSLMAIGGEVTAYMVLPLLRDESLLRNTALIILKSIGEAVIPHLYLLLSDKDDDIRKFALDLISDIRHCDYMEKVVELLKNDPNANVRASAAKAIGILQHKEGLPELIEALKDEEWVCFSALEAIAEMKSEDSVESIIALLNNSSDAIRLMAIEAMGKIGSSSAINALKEHLNKAEGIEKTAIIKSLIQMDVIPSIKGISNILIEMLSDGEWNEKMVAIKGLITLKEKDTIYSVVDFAGSLDPSLPENEDRLIAIKDELLTIGCSDLLINILEDPSLGYRGKVIAIDIIGDLKCKKAIPTLTRLLHNSESRDIRRASIKSLSEINNGDARDVLIKAVKDHDSHVRKTAVIALGKIGSMEAFEPIMKLLHTERYQDIIEEAVNSLLSINSSLFMSHIPEFNDDIKGIVDRITNQEMETPEIW